MSRPVIAPRRRWNSISAAARDLDCAGPALYPYLVWAGQAWRLAPLDPGMYRRWHEAVWRRHPEVNR